MGFSLNMIKTPNGHNFLEVVSAFQKAVRRGEEEKALYWASEIDQANYGKYLWFRILTIVTEDIGPAAPVGFAADIHALYGFWCERKEDHRKKKKEGNGSYGLVIADAVIRICRVQKSRVADDAYCVFWRDKPMRGVLFEIPDEALDEHTQKGRKMGRGWKHFVAHASHLENVSPDCPNPYHARFIEGCERFGNPDTYMDSLDVQPDSRPKPKQQSLLGDDASTVPTPYD